MRMNPITRHNLILSLETATDICSVSFQDSSGSIHEKRMLRKGSHSEYVFIFIRELMQSHRFTISELDALLVSSGPGSYTGLRIAASAAKGLLFDTNVPVYAANTLACFARGVCDRMEHIQGKKIHAVINARRSHLYHQAFTIDEGLASETSASIRELTQIEKLINPGDILIGTGISRISKTVTNKCIVMEPEAISANAVITLFRSKAGQAFFTKTTPEELDANYISSSQINNTPAKDEIFK